MKKFLCLFISIATVSLVKAQFANTSWKGSFNIPDPTEMVLQFKSDSLLLNYPGGSNLETMSYKINNDSMFILKLNGQSPCSYSDTAIYKVKVEDKKLFITSLTDGCPDRVSAWPQDGLERIE
jgi:hypothetical protein